MRPLQIPPDKQRDGGRGLRRLNLWVIGLEGSSLFLQISQKFTIQGSSESAKEDDSGKWVVLPDRVVDICEEESFKNSTSVMN